MKITMEELVNYAKQYGFIFQGSEIYNGLANSWDYGPLGTNLKENIRNAWKKKFIEENPYNYGIDCAIIMNPEVWVASGHVASFADPLIDCKKCKKIAKNSNSNIKLRCINIICWSGRRYELLYATSRSFRCNRYKRWKTSCN